MQYRLWTKLIVWWVQRPGLGSWCGWGMSVWCDVLARFISVTAKTIISSLSFFGFVFLSLGKKAEQLATTGNCEVTCSVHLSPTKAAFTTGSPSSNYKYWQFRAWSTCAFTLQSCLGKTYYSQTQKTWTLEVFQECLLWYDQSHQRYSKENLVM